jgi:hypothetical protein
MSSKSVSEIVDLIAEECREDFVGLWEIIKEIRRAFPDESDNRIQAMSLEVVSALLNSGRAVAGDLSGAGKFNDWRATAESTIARIKREWEQLKRDPNISEIVWLTAPPN